MRPNARELRLARQRLVNTGPRARPVVLLTVVAASLAMLDAAVPVRRLQTCPRRVGP